VSPVFAGVSVPNAAAAAPARRVPTRERAAVQRDVAVSNEVPSANRPTAQNGSGAVVEQNKPLNDLFGDVSALTDMTHGSREPAIDQQALQELPSGNSEQPVADPFAALSEGDGQQAPPVGEATRFFIAQAGVNKRNPPWKIALFVFSLIGLPTAVLYLLSTFKVVQLPTVTVLNENGQEEQQSFFSPGGVSGLKDILTGDAKRRKDEADRREKERLAALEAAKQRALAAKTPGEAVPDQPGPPKPVNPALAMNYADLDDPNKTQRGPRDRDATNAAVLASSGLKDEVAGKVVADNLKAFNTCIENALRRNPNLKVGSVNVSLNVGASGAVKSVTISPKQHEGTDWGGCMMQAGKRIVFPASDGETEVQVPLKVGVAM
jgi:hypothetical protein